jgi:hypothetical protein
MDPESTKYLVCLASVQIAYSYIILRSRRQEVLLAILGTVSGLVCFSLESFSNWLSDEVLIFGIGVPCLLHVAFIVGLIFSSAFQRIQRVRHLAAKAAQMKKSR